MKSDKYISTYVQTNEVDPVKWTFNFHLCRLIPGRIKYIFKSE